MFIVKHEEGRFLRSKAKKCATELIEYKEKSGSDREISLGDLTLILTTYTIRSDTTLTIKEIFLYPR